MDNLTTGDNKAASVNAWRKLFNEETGGSYYRRRRANMAFL